MTQTTEQSIPSLTRFEQAVSSQNYEAACTELLSILGQLDSNFGEIHSIEFAYPAQLQNLQQDVTIHFCTRMATAITTLFTNKMWSLTDDGRTRFLTMQRWINMIFASSPYVNADHVLATYNTNPEPDSLWNNIHLDNNQSAFNKFAVMYLPESNVQVNLDSLWNVNPSLTASLCFAWQSPRFIATEAAFNRRAQVLQWFPAKLAQFSNLNTLPANISHDVYMHCSYDIEPNKHDVKGALNQVIRRHILEYGWQDCDVTKIGNAHGKPVMLVLLEHFHAGHSIYRTHSTSMIAAREQFYLIGIGGAAVDEAGRAVFDEFVEIDAKASTMEKLQAIRTIAAKEQPAVFYMPSIGMDLTTIFASNTRIAPIQVIALGHPATTHSKFIEYVIVEDDYVGSEECFSETLLRLPKDALPYVPSALAPASVEYNLRENPSVVHIGVASTTMKLNPYFLKACAEIKARSKVPVHFHFAMGQASGVTFAYIERFLKTYLGKAVTAYPHQSYTDYLRTLHQCDMMINPFPFGNTNGIIDMVTLGLVGVCKTGAEVHEHIDEGLFKRLGLPEWLITQTADDYVNCVVRLAENHEERLALRRHIIENNGLNTLFSGDPKPMGQILWAKVQEKMAKPAKKAEAKAASKKAAAKPEPTPAAAVEPVAEKPATKTVRKTASKKVAATEATTEKAAPKTTRTRKKAAE